MQPTGKEVAGKIKSFQDLRIWQKGIQLVENVYAVSRSFPKEERYGLQSQLRRAAVSIPSNIAEGFARLHNKEYRNFLYISLGSCAELTTQIIIASRLKYIEGTEADALMTEIDRISKMTMSLIKKLNTNN
ncbi:MAG: four helix bundle protein [Planctomycetota bacterium]|jgi:four helix bundle protein